MAGNFEQYKNSFCGEIDGIPNINVDNFIDRNKMAYFLSHMHSDHYGGLVGKDQSGADNALELAKSLKKNEGKIYMTKESKIIFRKQYVSDYQKVKDYLVVLKTGKQHDLDLKDLKLSVTLIPVVHMPGAVMFLFKTPEGKTVLYTGDFVFDSEDLKNFKALHDTNNKPIAIDLIYYDATFDNDTYRHKSLPDTTKCIEAATLQIKKWLLDEQGNAVAIHIPYKYGFEGLFYGIVKKLQEKSEMTKLGNIKISMKDQNVFDVYRKIQKVKEKEKKDVEDVYTFAVLTASRIHICGNNITNSHKNCFTDKEAHKQYSKYLNIAVSTLNWETPSDKSPIKMTSITYGLCYPTQDKLDEFITYFNPKDCKPFSSQCCSSTTRKDRDLVPGEPNESQGIDGIPNINVDNFIDTNKMAYFLSYMDSDHYGGLVGKEQNALELAKSLKTNRGKIYMTEESKKTFQNQYVNDYQTVKDYLVVLETGKQHDLEDLKLSVTLIPVVHMPGAVMFLFKTPEGKTVLYMGDFVFDSEDLKNFKALHDTDNKPIAIDLIYYDATFTHHKSLPDTTKCIEAATVQIEKWLLDEPGNAVAIYIPPKYGFKRFHRLIYGIVKELQKKSEETKLGNIKISMKDNVFDVYGEGILNDDENVYTETASRIHICKMNTKKINTNFDKKMNSHENCFTDKEAHKQYSKYLNIAVSTLKREAPSYESPIKMISINYGMCYPTHCSQDKLDEFKTYFTTYFYDGRTRTVCKPFPIETCSSTTRKGRKLVPGESNESQGILAEEEGEQAITKELEQLSLLESPK